VIFILVGILVNVGNNRDHHFIGFENWTRDGAPFIGGISGFAHVFVTASFAFGGTESLGITAGETKNPSKNMPRIVKFVFWRILLFYLLSIAIIGLNVPWDYPNLSNASTTTSPFTIVFKQFGDSALFTLLTDVPDNSHIYFSFCSRRRRIPYEYRIPSFLSSVMSAGNHALFSGMRILYGLAQVSQAPPLFARRRAKACCFPRCC